MCKLLTALITNGPSEFACYGSAGSQPKFWEMIYADEQCLIIFVFYAIAHAVNALLYSCVIDESNLINAL